METPHLLRRSVIVAALTLFIATSAAAQNPVVQETPELVKGIPVSKQLNGTEVHSYQIALPAGQYSRVVVEQRGIDVVVRVVNADGHEVTEVDTPNGAQGPELISIVSESAGAYRIEIRALKKDSRGNYEVRLDEVRSATARDRNLVSAQAAYAEGDRARSQKRRPDAIRKYEEALRLYRAALDRNGEIATLNVLASGYHAVGEKQKSLDHYAAVLQLYRDAGNRQGQADALHSIGVIYNAPDANSFPTIADRQMALEHFYQAIALYKELGAPKREAFTLVEIGGIYNALGERQKALQHLNQALSIQRSKGDRRREGYTLADIGATYSAMGNKRTAIEYFNQAIVPFRDSADRFGEASLLTQMAAVFYSLGEPDKAHQYLAQALPLHQAQGNGGWEAATLAQFGLVHHSRGEAQKALTFLNQALSLQKVLNNRGGEAQTLTYLGMVHNSMGDWPRAEQYFNQALALSRVVFDRNIEANVLLNLARAERDRNNLAVARQHTERAIENVESLRTMIVSQDWRASYLASKRDYYEFYIDLLMRLHQESPAKGHDAAALQASERARARSLLETLSEARIDIREGVDSQLLAQEQELQQQINNKELQRIRLLSGKTAGAPAQPIEKELNALLTSYNEVRAQVRARSPRYDALMQPEPLTLREIQQQVLDEETVLLEYALGDEKSYLWVITQTDLTSFTLPKRAVVESAARRVYELLTNSNKLEARRATELAASDLGQMVLGPAAALLQKKRLLIVSEGALQYVPFAALSLPDATRAYRPLLATHEVISLPSASVLAVLRKEAANREVAPRSVAVLADAVFQSDDSRLQQVRVNARSASLELAGEQLGEQSDLVRSAKESGVVSFQRLPFTRQEAEAIINLAGESASFKALDFVASRETVFDARLDQYRIVHFATHGLLNSRHPELSGIVLSLVDKEGRARDGFLRTHDIYNLKLRANLVVLSACRTALGNEVKGEGLLGLTRGFMYSGTPRVVASLWDVRDEATSKLMAYFYEKMLRDNLSPAAALRAAQLKLLKDPRWQSPYYWAGFTLQGDWK
jgi:CHAT domain-containing protein/tetratricopeptide (TPR) repeat protein